MDLAVVNAVRSGGATVEEGVPVMGKDRQVCVDEVVREERRYFWSHPHLIHPG